MNSIATVLYIAQLNHIDTNFKWKRIGPSELIPCIGIEDHFFFQAYAYICSHKRSLVTEELL